MTERVAPFPTDDEGLAGLVLVNDRLRLALCFHDALARSWGEAGSPARALLRLARPLVIGLTVPLDRLCRHTGLTAARVAGALAGWDAWAAGLGPAVGGIGVALLPGGAAYRVTFDCGMEERWTED